MENFTPVSALVGGALIGLAAALLLLLNGRIAGISGILGDVLGRADDGRAWRLAFIAGLIAGPLVYGLATGGIPSVAITSNPVLLIAGGLLVGFGTRLGSGCTSGHGVCGIARLSPRSLVATIVFMAAGMITVFVTRHLVA